jgi:AraC-like DNA-binding protein
MKGDTLSDLLRTVRLTGAVYFSVNASAPWVAEAPPSSQIGDRIMPGVDHVIEFHVVASGECWGGVVGGEAARLGVGDVIVFPHGDAHVLSSAPGMRGVPDPDTYPRAGTSRLPIAMRIGGSGPERAEVICGFFGCDASPFNPLLTALPRMIHLPRDPRQDGVVDAFIRLALSESMAEQAGGGCVLARLSELLFVDVVRRYVATLPAEQIGWLSGLRDDGVGRALGKLHDRPEQDWSLDSLAREVGMSRSVLAERFTLLVGVPPMQYLARWRMQLVSTLLASTTMTLAEIAARVGYGSEAALSRAYKRCVGVAPADYRRRKRGDASPEA